VEFGSSCSALMGLGLPQTTITYTLRTYAGSFLPSAPGPVARSVPPFSELPEFCRVKATLKPGAESTIEIELWMPTESWNGKFLAVGNSGADGSINYMGMAEPVARGFATASTDTSASPAVHAMTVTAKRIIESYYGRSPWVTFFNGCGTGGRQGLVAAERYPDDFDGIIAGAPALTSPQASVVTLAPDPARRLSDAQLARVADAVLAACDRADGLADGVVSDPERCTFDPATLACPAGGVACLTPPQVETVRAWYAAGFAKGSERGWRLSPDDRSRVAAPVSKPGAAVDATTRNLSTFTSTGGRLLLYQGWADPTVPAGTTIEYYRTVTRARPDQASAVRLFMLPGVGHCGGGEGADTADLARALETWVEKRQPPDRIEASRLRNGQVERTRPLCAYPAVSTYTGGSASDAASFVCRTP
jgi:feruloyl esterase